MRIKINRRKKKMLARFISYCTAQKTTKQGKNVFCFSSSQILPIFPTNLFCYKTIVYIISGGLIPSDFMEEMYQIEFNQKNKCLRFSMEHFNKSNEISKSEKKTSEIAMSAEFLRS